MTITLKQKICSVFHLELKPSWKILSAKIWNALMAKFNVNVPLSKVKVSLKQDLLSNLLIITYPK